MGKNDGAGVPRRVFELTRPIAEGLSLSLWDVEFKKEGAHWYLRILVDKEGGVGIDDCEALSREISDMLDREDPIPHFYFLEVGSAGLTRELKTPEHFAHFIGEKVCVKLYSPRDELKSFTGILESLDPDGSLTIDADGRPLVFKKGEYAKVNLHCEI